jgi:hypothetical protein
MGDMGFKTLLIQKTSCVINKNKFERKFPVLAGKLQKDGKKEEKEREFIE